MIIGFNRKSLPSVLTPDKGWQIASDLILFQYRDKPLVTEFLKAFFSEMDILFNRVEEIYFGRFLEYAQGVQLDVLGQIVGQPRTIVIPTGYFAFVGVLNAKGMADRATPEEGGVFKDRYSVGGIVLPLSDKVYARMIRTKAATNMMETISINDAYQIIRMALDRQLQTLAFTPVGDKNVKLTLSSSEVKEQDYNLILYCTRYFLPMGTRLEIELL